MIPATTERVRAHTARHVNIEIRRRTDRNVLHHARYPEEIPERLQRLDREWDIERTLEANAATIGLIGLGLGLSVDRRWLLLPLAVAGFLLQHAVQGWCPPIPVFRRLGIRTSDEIARERYALKALRGDFAVIPAISDPSARADAALRATDA